MTEMYLNIKYFTEMFLDTKRLIGNGIYWTNY